jgi:hypothetical protein
LGLTGAGATSAAVVEAVPSPTAGGAPRVGGLADATQVQVVGQSASAVQTISLAWQYPGKLVTVVQVVPPSLTTRVPPSESRGATVGDPMTASLAAPGLATPEPPAPVPPPLPTPPLLEHVPLTEGAQVKSSPQSWSVLHGNCHLKAHLETVLSTQLSGGGGGVGTSHLVLGGQAGRLLPPLHETDFSV